MNKTKAIEVKIYNYDKEYVLYVMNFLTILISSLENENDKKYIKYVYSIVKKGLYSKLESMDLFYLYKIKSLGYIPKTMDEISKLLQYKYVTKKNDSNIYIDKINNMNMLKYIELLNIKKYRRKGEYKKCLELRKEKK